MQRRLVSSVLIMTKFLLFHLCWILQRSRLCTHWKAETPEEIPYEHNNNSIQFFIIYVKSRQLQDQLQTQHSVDTSNYIIELYNIKSQTNYRQALEKKSYWCKIVNKIMMTMMMIILLTQIEVIIEKWLM
jgi:hypothetical protein